MAYSKWFPDWRNKPEETTPVTAEFLEHAESALDTQDERITALEDNPTRHTIQDEGVAVTQRAGLNFIGGAVAVTDDSGNNRTNVTVTATGGSGHTIQDEGTGLTARTGLNFLGSGVTVTDDSGNNRTNVSIPGGGGGSSVDDVIILDTGSAATAGTAINAAIAALPSTGGTITIPGGTWTLDTGIVINKNGITIEGVGVLATRLVYAPGTVPTAIRNTDTTQRLVVVRDLMIDATGASGGTAIDASYFVNSQFERIRIGDGSTHPQRGIVFDGLGTYYNTVRDCRITVAGTGSYGLYFDNNANSNSVYDVRILGDTTNSVGIRTLAAHTNTFYHLDCEVNLAIAARIRGNNTKLVGCYFEGNALGLQLEADTDAFAMIGGYLENTSNLNDLGAINPMFINVWRSFSNYTSMVKQPEIKTGSYTLTFFDIGKTIEMNSASPTTVTVPPNSTVKFPVGAESGAVRVGAGSVTIAPGAGVTLRSSRTLVAAGQWSVIKLYQRAVDEWVVYGDVT